MLFKNINSNRILSSLDEVCSGGNSSIQTGPFGSQLHKEDYVSEGTPIITVEHLLDNRISHDNTPKVSGEDKQRLSKYVLQKGDIVFSRVGSVDRRSIVRESEDGWLFSGRCLRVRANETKIDPLYLSYYLGHAIVKTHLRSIAVGATMPSLNTKLLAGVEVLLPRSLHEQRQISNILGTLDDKIELNRKTNETLEGIAKALFKSWFVDFDPVRAKAEGRPTGLPDEISELFPVSFEESELGEIPYGWSIKSLGDICSKIGSGQTPRGGKEAYRGGDYALIRSQNVYNEKFSKDGLVFINDLQALQLSNVEVLPGDILVNITGDSVARTCQVPASVLPARVNQHVSIARADSQYATSSFIRFFLVEPGTQSLLHTLAAGGATRNALTKGMLETLPVVVPPIGIQQAFDAMAGLILEKQESIQVANSLLSSLRDTLLPKLISGEIRVPDTEKLLEEVGV